MRRFDPDPRLQSFQGLSQIFPRAIKATVAETVAGARLFRHLAVIIIVASKLQLPCDCDSADVDVLRLVASAPGQYSQSKNCS